MSNTETFEQGQPVADLKGVGLQYGLIAGVVAIVYSLVRYMINIDLYIGIGWVMATYVLIIGFMVAAAIAARKLLGGAISFKQALQATFLTSVISLVLWGLFTWVMSNYVDENINKYSKAKAMEFNEWIMEKSGANEEQIEAQLDEIDKQDFSQNFPQFMLGIAGQIVIGFFYAVIISGVFHLAFNKRKPEGFPE